MARDENQFWGLEGLRYPVPAHANSLLSSLGGLSLAGLGLTVLSGLVLSQFYNPTPQVAHGSVAYISSTPGLAFVRGIHHWSANLSFVLLLAHLVRVLVTGAFRPPRLVNYLVGLGLLFVTFQLFFSGTVIKWDQEGYEALGHFLAVNKLLGPLGAFFAEDFTLSTTILARIHSLHVSLFPILLLALVGIHTLYVKYFGLAPKPFQSPVDYQAGLVAGLTFLDHLKRLFLLSLVFYGVIVLLALIFPPGLLQPPKPGVEMTKPPWPFWVFYPLESAVGIAGILLGSLAVGGGLVAVPLLALLIREERKQLLFVRALVIIGLLIWAGLMVITYFSPTMQHL